MGLYIDMIFNFSASKQVNQIFEAVASIVH